MKTSRADQMAETVERVFHEPNRLAVMSAVCASDRGATFNELKAACGLTDGNLNRHLKVLAEAGAVRIEKAFVDDKPRTTVHVTSLGLARFNDYLAALAKVLQKAKRSLAAQRSGAIGSMAAKPATA